MSAGSTAGASRGSAGTGAGLRASSGSETAGGNGGTSQDPSSIHSENGFGSSSQVPGLSQAALRTGAGVTSTQTAGSIMPTYLLIALIAAAAIGMGLLATRRPRGHDDLRPQPAHHLLRPSRENSEVTSQSEVFRTRQSIDRVDPGSGAASLLLVRNGVDHDARVLRAARVARTALGGSALIVGVATTAAPAGHSTVEGVPVLRLPARLPRPAWLRRGTSQRTQELAVTPGNASRSSARLTPAARARRVLGGLSFALQAILVARRVRPRLVHANDWNTMWSGVAIKLAYGGDSIYDSHELWADRNGRWEWRPVAAGKRGAVRARR